MGRNRFETRVKAASRSESSRRRRRQPRPGAVETIKPLSFLNGLSLRTIALSKASDIDEAREDWLGAGLNGGRSVAQSFPSLEEATI